MLGGPPNTTYSENTAVLAATGNYNPVTLRIAALIAIIVSFFGKAIGEAVIGGPNFSLTNIGLGIIAGILLNLILPEPKETDPGLIAHTVEESEIVEERK